MTHLQSSWGWLCSYLSLTWDTPMSGCSQWNSPVLRWLRRRPKQDTHLTLWMSTIFCIMPWKHTHKHLVTAQYSIKFIKYIKHISEMSENILKKIGSKPEEIEFNLSLINVSCYGSVSSVVQINRRQRWWERRWKKPRERAGCSRVCWGIIYDV